MSAGLDIAATADNAGLVGGRPAARPTFLEPPGQLPAGRADHGTEDIPVTSGLPRPRLLEVAVDGHRGGAVIVTGPPGSGKSELLTQLGEHLVDSGELIGWLSVDQPFWRPQQVVDGVAEALLGSAARDQRHSIRRLAADVDHAAGPRTLVVDNAHLLAGPAGVAFGRVVESLPRSTRFVLAARSERDEWSTPLRLAGSVRTVGGAALRFQADEVDALFREHYQAPLPWSAVAALTERTEGWIMAIHLFHLSTCGRSADRRAAAVHHLAKLPALRRYLGATVLADLPTETMELLRYTSAFTSVVPQWCDALLGRSDTAWNLERLVDQNLLVDRLGDEAEPGYRYHPLLRAHLMAELRGRIDPVALRAHYHRIARFHESIGRDHEALDAYVRAADVRGSSRVLAASRAGGTETGAVLLARARSLAVSDRLDRALDTYRDAADALLGTDLHEVCAQERELVGAWSSVEPPTGAAAAHWLGQLRRALAGRPAMLAEHPLTGAGDGWQLAAGVAAVLDGRPEAAARCWARMSSDRGDLVGLLGAALRAVVDHWSDPEAMASGLELIADQADADGLPAVADGVRALAAVSGLADSLARTERIESACHADGRRWISLVATAAAAIGQWRRGGDADAALRRCDRRAADLRAGAFADAVRTITSASRPESDERSDGGQSAAAPRVPGVTVPAGPPPRAMAVRDEEAGPLRIRCFGRFELAVGDHPIGWRALRPRAQSVLRLLTLRANRGVHVDTLYQCFWPGAPLDSARRSLHVAVSMIRRVLTDSPAAGWGQSPLERRGDMYVLDVPRGGDMDLLRFHELLRQWHAASRDPDSRKVLMPLRAAFSLYRGDLLPEEGSAEWVLADRARYRALVLEVAAALAKAELKAGNPGQAAVVCNRAIEIDRFHDSSWKLLIRAYQASDELGAAQQARNQYREVLAELGVDEL